LQGRAALVFAGLTACALIAGVGAGLGVLVTGGHMSFLEGIEGGVNLIPAEILFLGTGVLLFAFVPRYAIGVLYGVVSVAFVWDLFGALLSLPNWALDLSPFHHVAPAPARSIAIVSALVMVALGAAATALGTIRFRHRDLTGD
jgi:ABC-2 type transport system permease protein